MQSIEFNSSVINGMIPIPVELISQVQGELHVVVLPRVSEINKERPSIKKMIKEGVFHIDHQFIPLTREEAHER